jgi:nucleotidyltransferase substrate binding protein (TIGR01987 family)
MEDLNHKHDNFKKCYEALGKVIALQEQLEYIAMDNSTAEDLFTAGVIKHFELAYETGWKFLKEYLREKHNHEALSPKAIFRACQDYRVFPEIMVNDLITLADVRNNTTHIYNQILAQEVCNEIEKHYEVFGKILEMIKI